MSDFLPNGTEISLELSLLFSLLFYGAWGSTFDLTWKSVEFVVIEALIPKLGLSTVLKHFSRNLKRGTITLSVDTLLRVSSGFRKAGLNIVRLCSANSYPLVLQ